LGTHQIIRPGRLPSLYEDIDRLALEVSGEARHEYLPGAIEGEDHHVV
jgi:hypothetical protein